MDVNFLNSLEESALIITMNNESICNAASDCTDNTIFHLLPTTGADVNHKTIQGHTALMCAVRNEDMICTQMLLKAGVKSDNMMFKV